MKNSWHSDGHMEKAQYLADDDSDGDGGDHDKDEERLGCSRTIP